MFCFHGLPTVEERKTDTFRVLFSWTAHCWSEKSWHILCSVFIDCPLLKQEKLTHFVFCFHRLPTVEVRKADRFCLVFPLLEERSMCAFVFSGEGENAWAHVVVLYLLHLNVVSVTRSAPCLFSRWALNKWSLLLFSKSEMSTDGVTYCGLAREAD